MWAQLVSLDAHTGPGSKVLLSSLSHRERINTKHGVGESHSRHHRCLLEEPELNLRIAHCQGWLEFQTSSVTMKLTASMKPKPVTLSH